MTLKSNNNCSTWKILRALLEAGTCQHVRSVEFEQVFSGRVSDNVRVSQNVLVVEFEQVFSGWVSDNVRVSQHVKFVNIKRVESKAEDVARRVVKILAAQLIQQLTLQTRR